VFIGHRLETDIPEGHHKSERALPSHKGAVIAAVEPEIIGPIAGDIGEPGLIALAMPRAGLCQRLRQRRDLGFPSDKAGQAARHPRL
jgi:hypothetical protein